MPSNKSGASLPAATGKSSTGYSPRTGPSPSASKSISKQDQFQAAQLAELERIKHMMDEIDDYELEVECEAPALPAAALGTLSKRAASTAAGSKEPVSKKKAKTSTAQPETGRSTRSQLKAAA